MKKFILVYLLILLSFVPINSFADISIAFANGNNHNYNTQVCDNSIITIGANYSHVNIKPSGNSSFNGNLGGLHAMYEYRPLNSFYGAALFKWRQGRASGSEGSRSILDLNVAERLGYVFGFKDNRCLWTLFSGFGFRFLGHRLNPAALTSAAFIGSFFPPFITEENSLKINYHDFYMPVGFLLEYSICSRFDLGLYATWMPQIFSTAKIQPLSGTFWDLKETYGNVLVEVPLIFRLTQSKNCSLVLKPFYEFWQDGKSTAQTSTGIPLGLPKNTYHFVGVNLDFLYSF